MVDAGIKFVDIASPGNFNTISDNMWHITGSISLFFFGAREFHYRRKKGRTQNKRHTDDDAQLPAPDDDPLARFETD